MSGSPASPSPAAPGAARRAARPGRAGRATAGRTTAGRRSRDRILQASLDLITEAGIDQVRLAGIAERAGMSSGQVMYYFTSMEHILLETLAWREDEETRQRRASLPATPAGWPQLEQFVDLYLPTSLTDPVWIMWMEAWARAPHSTEVSGFLDQLMRPWRDGPGRDRRRRRARRGLPGPGPGQRLPAPVLRGARRPVGAVPAADARLVRGTADRAGPEYRPLRAHAP